MKFANLFFFLHDYTIYKIMKFGDKVRTPLTPVSLCGKNRSLDPKINDYDRINDIISLKDLI